MNKFIGLLFVVIFFSCQVKPIPLLFGQDSCYTCKMTLMDMKFGAEIVTKKGKTYKFDDLNCMINFYNGSQEKEDNMEFIMVVNFEGSNEFINAREAFYVKTDKKRTPMASQVAAFSTKEQLDRHNKEWRGIVLSWGELVTQYK